MEDVTFRRLKRTPFEEVYQMVLDCYDKPSSMPPVYKLGSEMVVKSKFYHPMLEKHARFIKILDESNWTFDEFSIESEKRAIISQIEEYNERLELPEELIDRARQFFPNIKLTPAKLEWE